MKKVGSVMALFARESLRKVLVTLVVMCLVQAGMYYAAVQRVLAQYQTMENSEAMQTPLLFTVVTWIAFLFISWLLAKQGTGSGSQPTYTLRRLQLTEQQIWACQAVYQTLVYFLFWAVLTVLHFGLLWYFLPKLPDLLVSSQSLFLMAYQQPRLHGLLPLADGWGWVRNLVWFVTLGMSVATASMRLRRNQPPVTTIILLAAILVGSLGMTMGDAGRLALGICVPVLLVVLDLCYTVFDKWKEEPTAEQGGMDDA